MELHNIGVTRALPKANSHGSGTAGEELPRRCDFANGASTDGNADIDSKGTVVV